MRRVKRKEGTPHVFQCSIYRSGRPVISFSERAPSSLPSGCPLLNVPKSLRSQGVSDRQRIRTASVGLNLTLKTAVYND